MSYSRDFYGLLKFLLIHTAAVRKNVKPAEILRIRHNRQRAGDKQEGSLCAQQKEILRALNLNYYILRTNETGILVLFYSPELLEKTLWMPQNAKYLQKFGYACEGELLSYFCTLKARFQQEVIPHEIGIFLGYPLKDVMGFMNPEKSKPVYRGAWQVFGDVEESLILMRRYKQAAREASEILQKFKDFEICMQKIAAFSRPERTHLLHAS
ncbi:MAG: DUF3793 family protein [Planctomycetia bacterium]|nr:DUF3793 family protein [Planctomycetia bacterium]